MKFFRFARSLVVVAVLLAGPATVFAQVKPDKDKKGGDGSTNPPKKAGEGVAAAVDPNKYVLGAEDVIFIRTWREPDFTFQLAIRPDGKITMPLVGDVQASGLTPLALTQDLKEKLGKYLNTPDVTVMVLDVRSKKYFMDGEIARPGPYALVTPTTVLEAISMAGGFKEFANQKNIAILRNGKIFKFNYKEVIRGKHQDQNIFIANGDHIIIH